MSSWVCRGAKPPRSVLPLDWLHNRQYNVTNMEDQRADFKQLMSAVSHPDAMERWPKGAVMPDIYKVWHEQMVGCQLFAIEASNQQGRGDIEIQDTVPFLSTHREFNPLHDDMAFFLNKGDMVLPLHQTENEYAEVEIVGFAIHKTETPSIQRKLQLLFPSQKMYPLGDWYDCYIYSIATLRDGQDKGKEGINTQDCVFVFEEGVEQSFIHFPQHKRMCLDPKCSIDIFGTGTNENICREINARRAFVYALLEVMSEFNKPREVIHKIANTTRTEKIKPEKPEQKPNTVPTQLLISLKDIIIDRPRVIYDKITGHGKGGKHKIRYNVRRHIRVSKGKIIWISSYQRGDGEYLPRWHVKSKKMEITRYQRLIESVSTHSAIEPLLVRVIKYLRRRKCSER